MTYPVPLQQFPCASRFFPSNAKVVEENKMSLKNAGVTEESCRTNECSAGMNVNNTLKQLGLDTLKALGVVRPEWKKKNKFQAFYYHWNQITNATTNEQLEAYCFLIFPKVFEKVGCMLASTTSAGVLQIVKRCDALDSEVINEVVTELDALRECTVAESQTMEDDEKAQKVVRMERKLAGGKQRIGFNDELPQNCSAQPAMASSLSHGRSVSLSTCGKQLEKRVSKGNPSGAAASLPPHGYKAVAKGANVNIRFNEVKKCWECNWVVGAQRCMKTFSLKKFGHDKARKMATDFRKEKTKALNRTYAKKAPMPKPETHHLSSSLKGVQDSPLSASRSQTFDARKNVEASSTDVNPCSNIAVDRSLKERKRTSKNSGIIKRQNKKEKKADGSVSKASSVEACAPSPLNEGTVGDPRKCLFPLAEGVSYKVSNGCGMWQCRWVVNGRKYTKAFSVSRYGYQESRDLAINYRKQQLANFDISFQTVMQVKRGTTDTEKKAAGAATPANLHEEASHKKTNGKVGLNELSSDGHNNPTVFTSNKYVMQNKGGASKAAYAHIYQVPSEAKGTHRASQGTAVSQEAQNISDTGTEIVRKPPAKRSKLAHSGGDHAPVAIKKSSSIKNENEVAVAFSFDGAPPLASDQSFHQDKTNKNAAAAASNVYAVDKTGSASPAATMRTERISNSSKRKSGSTAMVGETDRTFAEGIQMKKALRVDGKNFCRGVTGRQCAGTTNTSEKPPNPMPGVTYDEHRQMWRAQWFKADKKPTFTSFSVSKYGFEGAMKQAILCRQAKINLGESSPRAFKNMTKSPPVALASSPAENRQAPVAAVDGVNVQLQKLDTQVGESVNRRQSISSSHSTSPSDMPAESVENSPGNAGQHKYGGVYLDNSPYTASRGAGGPRWVACWEVRGRLLKRSFLVSRYGFPTAKEKACVLLKKKEKTKHVVLRALNSPSLNKVTHKTSSSPLTLQKTPPTETATLVNNSWPTPLSNNAGLVEDCQPANRSSTAWTKQKDENNESEELPNDLGGSNSRMSDLDRKVEGVYWDKRTLSWHIDWPTEANNGTTHPSFSAEVYGFEEAKQSALKYRQDLEQQLLRSYYDGIPGVAYERARHCWRVTWYIANKELRRNKYFNISKHGWQRAKQLAIIFKRKVDELGGHEPPDWGEGPKLETTAEESLLRRLLEADQPRAVKYKATAAIDIYDMVQNSLKNNSLTVRPSISAQCSSSNNNNNVGNSSEKNGNASLGRRQGQDALAGGAPNEFNISSSSASTSCSGGMLVGYNQNRLAPQPPYSPTLPSAPSYNCSSAFVQEDELEHSATQAQYFRSHDRNCYNRKSCPVGRVYESHDTQPNDENICRLPENEDFNKKQLMQNGSSDFSSQPAASDAKGIYFNKNENVWVCEWPYVCSSFSSSTSPSHSGNISIRTFSVKTFGFENAKKMAEKCRLEMEKSSAPLPCNTQAENHGDAAAAFLEEACTVAYTPGANGEDGFWEVCWNEDSQRHTKCFSVGTLGFEKAKELAIDFRCKLGFPGSYDEGSFRNMNCNDAAAVQSDACTTKRSAREELKTTVIHGNNMMRDDSKAEERRDPELYRRSCNANGNYDSRIQGDVQNYQNSNSHNDLRLNVNRLAGGGVGGRGKVELTNNNVNTIGCFTGGLGIGCKRPRQAPANACASAKENGSGGQNEARSVTGGEEVNSYSENGDETEETEDSSSDSNEDGSTSTTSSASVPFPPCGDNNNQAEEAEEEEEDEGEEEEVENDHNNTRNDEALYSRTAFGDFGAPPAGGAFALLSNKRSAGQVYNGFSGGNS